MDINNFKNNIYEGMNFNKGSIIKVTDDGFTYAIGNNGNKKKVTFEEVEKAIKEVEATESINRKWYELSFPKRASSNPCNFTSICGVLELLNVKL